MGLGCVVGKDPGCYDPADVVQYCNVPGVGLTACPGQDLGLMQCHRMLDDENARRAANGQPPITSDCSSASSDAAFVPGQPSSFASSAQPAASGTGFIQIVNTSRPGQPLQAGDNWQVNITGATPNSPVSVSGTRNGASSGPSAVEGTTDGSGNFSTSGTMSAENVGNWAEQWAIAGKILNLQFSVVSSVPAAGGSSSGSGSGSASSSGSNTGFSNTLSLPSLSGWEIAALVGGALLVVLGMQHQ